LVACRGDLGAVESADAGDTTDGLSGDVTTSVSVGYRFTCAVDSGAAWCWGENRGGTLGVPSASLPSSAKPIAIGSFPFEPSGVSCGGGMACALSVDGRIACWGNTPNETDIPLTKDGVTNATSLSVGSESACTLTSDGRVWCWGANETGQLGIGSASPGVQSPQMTTGIAGARELTVGPSEGSCARLADGSVRCWGLDSSGQFGDGPDAAFEFFTPTRIGALDGFAKVSVGHWDGCGFGPDGVAQCWGSNAFGQLGRGTIGGDALSPAPIVGVPPEGFSRLYAGTLSTCGVTPSGTLWCWGNNDNGQLGQGYVGGQVSFPTMVLGLPTVTAVALGLSHSCAVTSRDGIWCWGANDMGQLGIGSMGPNVANPTRVVFPQ
jgi:alpha-tubulin suppressor-like RCC1 family protein